jgi:hypothetical protein
MEEDKVTLLQKSQEHLQKIKEQMLLMDTKT